MRRHGSPEELEAIRLRCVELWESGWSNSDIATALDRSVRTVQKWVKIARDQGIDSLKAKPHPGATPKLSDEQMQDLCNRLVAGALASGYSTDLWTCPRIAEMIFKVYGVTYHVDYLGQLLKSLGFSCQKPQRVAAERDQARISRWMTHDWERIKKRPGESTLPSFLSMKGGCC